MGSKGVFARLRKAELAFLLFLQERVRTEHGNWFWRRVTAWGNGSFGWLVLGGVLAILPSTREMAAQTFETIFVGELIINIVIKLLFRRKRPYDVCDRLTVIGTRMHDTSFPSGHTCMSFLLLFVYVGQMPPLFVVGVAGIGCMIAFSRMYLGVHYPSDILGGVVIGALLAAGFRAWLFPTLDWWLG